MSAITHDFLVNNSNNSSTLNNANNEEKITMLNNVIYTDNHTISHGNIIFNAAIPSFNGIKQFVSFGYSFGNIINSSTVNGEHMLTINVIPKF